MIVVCETVSETSSMICSAQTPNKLNSFGMIAQVLDSSVVEAVEKGLISTNISNTVDHSRIKILQEKCGWDALASRNIWSFGPEDSCVNVFVDDTLKSETNKELLYSIRESIVHGFQWSCREGPLCESPLRNTHFRLLSADIAMDPTMATSFSASRGQIIPTTRRLCYASVLLAFPRLLEPMYGWEILIPPSAISIITPAISRRRGFIRSTQPLPASPYHLVNAVMPLLDSFGFETEMRTMTRGQAYGQSIFEYWSMIPGDPLDTSITFKPLEPSPPESLAREVMLKVRRRKGLKEDIAIQSYFDEKMLMELASTQMEQ
jgi:U5 small nuclear ribonucleoprotein component